MYKHSLFALALLPTLWACQPDPLPYGSLTWTFPDNLTCAQAGIAYVDVRVDGVNPPDRYDCATGQASPGAATPFLQPGNHSIELWAVDTTGYAYYGLSSSLVLPRTGVTPVVYDLQWVVGGVAVDWQLYLDASTAISCSSAESAGGQAARVFVNFQNPQTLELLYPAPGDGGGSGNGYACNTTAIFSYLPAGTYQPRILANVGPDTYESASDAQLVTITAGAFPTTPATAPVPLYIQ